MEENKKMKIIGVTGRAGSGKTYLTESVVELYNSDYLNRDNQIYIIDVDKIAKRILKNFKMEDWDELSIHLGLRVSDVESLSKTVFNNEYIKELYDNFIKPKINNSVLRELSKCMENEKYKILIVSALLKPLGLEKRCDFCIEITNDKNKENLLFRYNGDTEKVNSIISTQKNLDTECSEIYMNNNCTRDIFRFGNMLMEHFEEGK